MLRTTVSVPLAGEQPLKKQNLNILSILKKLFGGSNKTETVPMNKRHDIDKFFNSHDINNSMYRSHGPPGKEIRTLRVHLPYLTSTRNIKDFNSETQ